MMMHAAAATLLRHAPVQRRPAMSNLRFFLTAYAGGLAFFWAILA